VFLLLLGSTGILRPQVTISTIERKESRKKMQTPQKKLTV